MALPALAAFPQSASVVSRWKLTESSGNRADSVGSNTLTNNNTVGSGTGQFSANDSTFAAASSQYLSITDASQSGLDIAGGTMSYAVWVKLASQPADGSDFRIAGKTTTTTNNRSYMWYYGIDVGVHEIFWDTSSDGTVGNTKNGFVTQTLSNGVWYHLCFTADGSGNGLVYVNGVQVGSAITINTAFFNGAAPFTIGTIGNLIRYFDGEMQDAVLWSVKLSANEVAILYNSYTKVFGGPLNIQQAVKRSYFF